MTRLTPIFSVVGLALFAVLPSAARAAPASGSREYVIGGAAAERTSMVFVDFSAVVRTSGSVLARLLMVQRDPRQVGGRTVLYSVMDAVLYCQARTMALARVRTYGPDGTLVNDIPDAAPVTPLTPGSAFAATAEVACSGKPRALDAPSFSSEGLAVEFARKAMSGQRPSDRGL